MHWVSVMNEGENKIDQHLFNTILNAIWFNKHTHNNRCILISFMIQNIMSQSLEIEPNYVTKLIELKVILQINGVDANQVIPNTNRYPFNYILMNLENIEDKQSLANIVLWIKNNLLWYYVQPDSEMLRILRTYGFSIDNSVIDHSNQKPYRYHNLGNENS